MNNDKYLSFTRTTVVYPSEQAVPYCALGLVGESGEVANKLKKVLRGDTELTPEYKVELAHELGDVAYYLFRLVDELGYTMDGILTLNMQKLQQRKEKGTIRGSGDNR